MRVYLKTVLPILIAGYFICTVPGFGQVAGIEDHLTSSDKKKMSKADDFEMEANALDAQGQELTLNGEEKKANTTLLKSYSSLQKAHDIRIGIYKQKLNEFRKPFTGQPGESATGQMLEDQSHDLFSRTETLRQKAKSIKDPNEQLSALAEALSFEKDGIKKQTDALNYYYNWPIDYKIDYNAPEVNPGLPPVIDSQTEPALDSAAVSHNDEQLLSLKKYLRDSLQMDDSAAENYISLAGYDKRNLSMEWYKYIYGHEWQDDTTYKVVADIVNYPSADDSFYLAQSANKKDIP